MTTPSPVGQDALLPCPFCGGAACQPWGSTATCCDTKGCAAEDIQTTPEAWNRRAHRDPMSSCPVCNAVTPSGAVAMSSETQTPSAEPVAWFDGNVRVVTDGTKSRMHAGTAAAYTIPLYAHPSPDVRDAERYPDVEFLEEMRVSMRHARTFLTSREKMNPTGVYLWDDIITRLDRAIDTAIAKEKL